MDPPLAPVVHWYDRSARDLPWRRSGTSPWQVLVSEVMLQQTPVTRVLALYSEWVQRWPTPQSLASSPVGEAIRAWGRLGYPRRALRLHAAACACVEKHGGDVPSGLAELRALPGVGEYTAAAVASFAFGQRQAVLDTNVRRVHARLLDGQALERAGSVTVAERRRALELLPTDPRAAAHTSIAVMELGALVCTARSPSCDVCPVAAACAWRSAGKPASAGQPRRGQTYEGTDRQCRGRVLAELRAAEAPQSRRELASCWPDSTQLDRALDSLVDDGLVAIEGSAPQPSDRQYRLPV